MNGKYKSTFKDIEKYYNINKKNNVNGGRKEALKILKNINSFSNYEKTRDVLSKNTTHLSAYLKFGCISIREVYHVVKNKFGINDDIIKQLLWRDFYYHVGNEYTIWGKSMKEKYNKIKWLYNKKHFNKWKNAMTGFPIVDAAMRQLNETGFMHNRGRLIVASFLIKNLQIDWLWGEKYFATQLIDYDPLVNNGNWQWVAGTGTDSQPYFRIFNPWSQSEKHDKDCIYIKKWIPELKNVDNKDIHKWYKTYKNYPNIKYPTPIIDYKKSREKTIDMYQKIF